MHRAGAARRRIAVIPPALPAPPRPPESLPVAWERKSDGGSVRAGVVAGGMESRNSKMLRRCSDLNRLHPAVLSQRSASRMGMSSESPHRRGGGGARQAVLEAVKRIGDALKWAALEHKADREIVLETVKKEWRAH